LPKPVRAQGTWQDFSEGHLQYIHRYFLFWFFYNGVFILGTLHNGV
jgi:hypothetical protein